MPIIKCFLSVGFCDHTLNHTSFQDILAVTLMSDLESLDTLWVLAGPPNRGNKTLGIHILLQRIRLLAIRLLATWSDNPSKDSTGIPL
jgi:hypothetical protein